MHGAGRSVILMVTIRGIKARGKGAEAQREKVTVHGFKGLGVQGSILVPGLSLGYVFTKKASPSSGLTQNLEPNWQLFAKTNIFDEDFRSSMPPLSLTLNVEP